MPDSQALTCINADVAVIGAGPAGAVASRELALAGCSVILIDPAVCLPKIGESLPAAAGPLLRDTGLLSCLEHCSHLAMGSRYAWGEARLRTHDAIVDPHGAGWHLDRGRFDENLRDAACLAGVRWCRERLQQLSRSEGQWSLQLSQTAVKARWLVDASGRASVVGRRLGVKRIRDQALIAVYAWTDCEDKDQRTLIESVQSGWWYSAKLPGARRVAAYHCSAEEALVLRGSQAWSERLGLTAHLQSLSSERRWSLPIACDASGGCLQQWGGEGWLAVGDAAMAFDPLSSQGIFNALYTGMRGAQAVRQSLDGRSGAMDFYSSTLTQVRQAYLRRLRHYYRSESRWPCEAFWRERGAVSDQWGR